MDQAELPVPLKGSKIHMVGIKGTGMTALAEYLVKAGAAVSGSDTPEVFPTDEMLKKLNISPIENFAPDNIPGDADGVVYSSAYDPAVNPELTEAARRRIPLYTYPEALGSISRRQPSAGIAGIHGKTTTTALSGVLVKALRLPGSVLVPTSVPDFSGDTVYNGGREFFITETCEYRRNFLNFCPKWVVFTSLELDHPDYFKSIDDVEDAFLSYLTKIQKNGSVIYYADSERVSRCVSRLSDSRPDISLIPYGLSADGPFRIITEKSTPGWNHFRLQGIDNVFRLRIPGDHLILDAAAALALTVEISDHFNRDYRPRLPDALSALENFHGTKRRSEFLGRGGGILFYDDYGHHPTAIAATIKGFKTFYPDRRIVVDFMAHTYTRTRTLLDEFAAAFTDADALILHRIYGSAREKDTDPALDGILYEVIRNNQQEVYYFPDVNEADSFLSSYLRQGDLFLTLGAGDNWKIGVRLMKKLTGENR